MEYIEVTLRDFETIVKRRDIKSPQWFAMPTDLLEHPDFFDITGDEFKAYIWICGVATKLNTSKIRVYLDLCARRIAISKQSVELSIEKLKGKRFDVHDTNGSVRIANADVTLHYTTLHNTTEHVLTKVNTTAVVEKSTPTAIEIKKPNDSFLSNDQNEILKNIPHANKLRWMNIYDNDVDFIQRELLKAIGYYFDNPKKKPKSKRGWLTALSSWLERGWGYRAKTIKGQESPQMRADELLKLINEDQDAVS